MFRAVVKELQVLGASCNEALRLANQIDYRQSIAVARIPHTAKAIAKQVWGEELEARQAIEAQNAYEEEQEEILESLYSSDY